MVLLTLVGCMTPRGFPPVASIQNFDIVDGRLTRGAQPNAVSIAFLKTTGITLVIDLTVPGETWPQERAECGKVGIVYVNVPLSGTRAPSRAAVDRILSLIQANQGVAFVHCQHGCDRTGTVVACYRIRLGESNEGALRDADIHGMSVFEIGMRSFIKHWKD